jgi:hypothetical protein
VIKIVEILGRSAQGATRPFICRGDDGKIYYVKGRGAGRRSQLCEWTAGHLARALELPIADFEIVDVPAVLLKLDMPHLDLHELGVGPAYGSVQVTNAAEFSIGDVGRVPATTRRDILLFDWWIRNDDRTLTEKGGNPNLLWDGANQKVVMIDHNLAYNSRFDRRLFLDIHAFAADGRAVWEDMVERLSMAKRFSNSLGAFDRACDTAPQEWSFADDDRGVPANFDRVAIRGFLQGCLSQDFWNIEP